MLTPLWTVKRIDQPEFFVALLHVRTQHREKSQAFLENKRLKGWFAGPSLKLAPTRPELVTRWLNSR